MRAIGYVLAVLVGLGVAAFFGMLAVVAGLCGTFGEQCSGEELDHQTRLWLAAIAAPFVVVGVYALIDMAVAAWWRRRSGSRP